MTAIMTAPEARPTAGPPPRYPRSDSLDLGAYPEVVSLARRRTRVILAEWGLAELADDAAQIVSELLANAVETHQREGIFAPVRLTLLAGLRTLLIVVRDADGGTPSPATPGDEDENGRGLFLVNALSAYWDTKPCPGGGKIVRAFLRAQKERTS